MTRPEVDADGREWILGLRKRRICTGDSRTLGGDRRVHEDLLADGHLVRSPGRNVGEDVVRIACLDVSRTRTIEAVPRRAWVSRAAGNHAVAPAKAIPVRVTFQLSATLD